MTKRRASPEYTLQCTVTELLGKLLPREVWFGAIPTGMFTGGPVKGPQLARAGYQNGTPDMLLIYHGKAHFIELKSKRGVLSDGQKAMAGRLDALRIPHAVCRSLPEVIGTLRGWGIPMLDVRVAA